MAKTKANPVTTTLEFKLAVVVSLVIVAIVAFYSQELDYFAAASPGFMFLITTVILIFSTVLLRSLSMALFNRNLYSYSFLPFLILFTSLLIALLFPFSKISVNNEFRHNFDRRKKAVDKVYFREWKANQYGIAKLPDEFANLSIDSSARFCDDDGVITVVFLTFRQNSRGSGIAYIEGMENENEIEKWVNRKDLFPFYPIKYRKLEENWYAISSDKDYFRELNFGN